jgi:hypothetical protein
LTKTSVRDRLALVVTKYDGEDAQAARLLEDALARLSWRLRHSGKTCSKCQLEKPLGAFTRDRQRPDGLSPWCRVCHALRRGGHVVATREAD